MAERKRVIPGDPWGGLLALDEIFAADTADGNGRFSKRSYWSPIQIQIQIKPYWSALLRTSVIELQLKESNSLKIFSCNAELIIGERRNIKEVSVFKHPLTDHKTNPMTYTSTNPPLGKGSEAPIMEIVRLG